MLLPFIADYNCNINEVISRRQIADAASGDAVSILTNNSVIEFELSMRHTSKTFVKVSWTKQLSFDL